MEKAENQEINCDVNVTSAPMCSHRNQFELIIINSSSHFNRNVELREKITQT